MKYIWIFLIVSVFTAYITIFLIQNQSPLNQEALRTDLEKQGIISQEEAISYFEVAIELNYVRDYINWGNLLFVAVFALSTFVSGFTLVHAIVDKLFFKKFYEQPNYLVGMRRGILIGLIPIVLVIFRVYFAFYGILSILSVSAIALVVEYLFTMSALDTSKPGDMDLPKVQEQIQGNR